MANTMLTIGMVTKEAARILSNNLVLPKILNRQYDDQFGIQGAKIGNTLNVRLPNRPVAAAGVTFAAQDYVDTQVPLTFGANSQIQIGMAFTSQDLFFSIDQFSERVIKPAMVQMANSIDALGYTTLMPKFNNMVNTGTALTTTTARDAVLTSIAQLQDFDMPIGDGLLSAVHTPSFNATLVGSNASLFNPVTNVSNSYIKGTFGEFGGARHMVSQNVSARTSGVYGGSGAVNGASQTGSSLITNGWTATTTALQPGDVFTIANVFSVNPQTRVSTGNLMQFTLTAAQVTDGSGNSTLAISPAIVVTGQGQNVNAGPVTTAAITVVSGASASVHKQSLILHRDAAMCANVKLPLPHGVSFAGYATDPMSGITVRIVQMYDWNLDREILRFDAMIAYAPLYQSLATRLQVT